MKSIKILKSIILELKELKCIYEKNGTLRKIILDELYNLNFLEFSVILSGIFRYTFSGKTSLIRHLIDKPLFYFNRNDIIKLNKYILKNINDKCFQLFAENDIIQDVWTEEDKTGSITIDGSGRIGRTCYLGDNNKRRK